MIQSGAETDSSARVVVLSVPDGASCFGFEAIHGFTMVSVLYLGKVFVPNLFKDKIEAPWWAWQRISATPAGPGVQEMGVDLSFVREKGVSDRATGNLFFKGTQAMREFNAFGCHVTTEGGSLGGVLFDEIALTLGLFTCGPLFKCVLMIEQGVGNVWVAREDHGCLRHVEWSDGMFALRNVCTHAYS